MSDPSSQQWHLPASHAALSISAGTLRPERDESVTEDNSPGLKLVLVLKGELRYAMPGRSNVAISSPSLHLSLSRQPFQVQHRFHRDQAVEYVAIRIPATELEAELGMETDLLARACQSRDADGLLHLDRNADASTQALARQLLLCPLRGSLRTLYLTGKAMELTAMALAGLTPSNPPACLATGGDMELPLRQRECLRQARDILQAQYQQPPDLASLARQVGLSVTLLTRGFRQMFGCSVYEYLRQLRLEQAYQLLASGTCSVSQAAWRCGYSDAHFSRAFQKRFGVSPRQLRG